MKKTFLMLFLSIGLITLAACTGDKEATEQALMFESESETEVYEDSFTNGSYQVDTAASALAWRAAKLAVVEHTGLVAIKSGNLEVIDGALAGGEFVMDMTSISSDENLDNLVTHLKSADFFDVANYPEARLVISNVSLEAESYLIAADLTIKGITAPITFKADLTEDDETILVRSEFMIDRTVWDIRFGSSNFFDNLGDGAINNNINFNVNLMANLQE